MEISKSKTALYSSLSTKKMRLKHKLFIVEGEKCVQDTLGAFDLIQLVATDDWIKSNISAINSISEDLILSAPKETLKKISSLSTPPDVVAVFRLPSEPERLPDLSGELVLALDGIQDPGNFGTILRTADWFGVNTVVVSKDTVDLFNPKTIQATMGALKRVKVYTVDLFEFIKSHPQMEVYGTLLNGENIFKTQLKSEGIIIMGNEGNGISENVIKLINSPLTIPPYHENAHGESLNVAIATAITLAEFRKR